MIMPVSQKEKELMAWLELIIMNSQPLNIVEDPIYRGFSAAWTVDKPIRELEKNMTPSEKFLSHEPTSSPMISW